MIEWTDVFILTDTYDWTWISRMIYPCLSHSWYQKQWYNNDNA